MGLTFPLKKEGPPQEGFAGLRWAKEALRLAKRSADLEGSTQAENINAAVRAPEYHLGPRAAGQAPKRVSGL